MKHAYASTSYKCVALKSDTPLEMLSKEHIFTHAWTCESALLAFECHIFRCDHVRGGTH